MKTIIKTLLAAAMCATLSSAFAESYTVTSNEGALSLKITLQGGGSLVLNDKSISKLLGTSTPLSQALNLNADHTMTGTISAAGLGPLFNLSGAWYRPANSKVIYFALDGDPTKGAASDGAYGGLFDRTKAAAQLSLSDFMPLLFGKKVTSIEPIYPAIKFTTGIIKLKLNSNGAITSSTSTMLISGRAMANYCKLDSEKNCTIPNGTKDAAFSFSANTKSTVVAVP